MNQIVFPQFEQVIGVMIEKRIPANTLSKRSASEFKNLLDNQFAAHKFVFDFDGVITSKVEDDIYHLEVLHGEKSTLIALAERLRIDSKIFDIQYLRHLIVQEILLAQSILPAPGPMFKFCTLLERQKIPYFILTARSGVAAIKRALSFLEKHELHPQEVFFVGRVPKGRQLAYVEKLRSDLKIIFFDDSPSHFKNAVSMEVSRDLESKYVLHDPNRSKGQALKLYSDCIKWAVDNLLLPRKDRVIIERADRLQDRIRIEM